MDKERFLTVTEVVDKLRVHEQTVRRWLREGELRGVNYGGRGGYRIRERDLDAFIAAREAAHEVKTMASGSR